MKNQTENNGLRNECHLYIISKLLKLSRYNFNKEIIYFLVEFLVITAAVVLSAIVNYALFGLLFSRQRRQG